MRYEAGPFAGIRFFRAVGEGLLVQSGRFLGLPGLLAQSGEGGADCRGESSRWRSDFSYRRELLAQSGEGRIAGPNHRAVGVPFRTVGATSFGAGAKALILF